MYKQWKGKNSTEVLFSSSNKKTKIKTILEQFHIHISWR